MTKKCAKNRRNAQKSPKMRILVKMRKKVRKICTFLTNFGDFLSFFGHFFKKKCLFLPKKCKNLPERGGERAGQSKFGGGGVLIK